MGKPAYPKHMLAERPQRGAEAVLLSLTFHRLGGCEIGSTESIPAPPIRS